MTMNAFNLFLGIMSLIALIVFICPLLCESRIWYFPHSIVGSSYLQ